MIVLKAWSNRFSCVNMDKSPRTSLFVQFSLSEEGFYEWMVEDTLIASFQKLIKNLVCGQKLRLHFNYHCYLLILEKACQIFNKFFLQKFTNQEIFKNFGILVRGVGMSEIETFILQMLPLRLIISQDSHSRIWWNFANRLIGWLWTKSYG